MVRPPFRNENDLKKGPWGPAEDQLLIDYIQKHGHENWRALPNRAGLNRCGKSCRLRWNNYLRPDIKRGKFSDEEEGLIVNLHSVLGNKWSQIASHLPGRTDNEVKNFWNTYVRKKFLHMGIDPKAHNPILNINFLANLSQLISTSNFGNLMNPLDNINDPLRLQYSDATQLAKIQLLHNLLQAINVSPFPNIEVNLLRSYNHYPNQFDGVTSEAINHYTMINHSQQPFNNPNEDISPITKYSLGFFSPQISSVNSLSGAACNITHPTENQLPPLVSDTPESSNTKEIDSMKPTNIPSDSTNSDNNIFEVLEKFVDGESNSTSFWTDVIDYYK